MISRPSSQSVFFQGREMPLEQAQALGWKPPGSSVEGALLGRAQTIDSDPRIAAAMKALNPSRVQSDTFSAFTDMSAAQAGSQADMLRDQMGAAGIDMNDPAAQARMRAIETNRMQANQTGSRDAQAAGRDAAGQIAQMRLAQMSQSNPFYSQYGGMKANQQTGQYTTGNAAAPQVGAAQPVSPTPATGATPSPWTPPTPGAAPSNTIYRQGGKDVTAEQYAAGRAQAAAPAAPAVSTWAPKANWAAGAATKFAGGKTPSSYDQGGNLAKYVTNLWGNK